MVEDRRHFPKRWPHLTTLYNSSPFISTTYKEVDEWNSLRPLPAPIGGYPPSYDDTYREGNGSVFASYDPQRQYSVDKFGRNFAGAPPNYDAFSTSTYQTLPHLRKKRLTKTTHFLACAIGVSLMLALIGALAAIVIVLSNGSECDGYGDSVWVLDSPYDISKLDTDVEINHNFTRDFCDEMEDAFRQYFEEDHVCGCSTVEISIAEPNALVFFNIEYRKINKVDKNETYVGIRLATILNSIINDSMTPSFSLSYLLPPEFSVTEKPMLSVGKKNLAGNGTNKIDGSPGNGSSDGNGTSVNGKQSPSTNATTTAPSPAKETNATTAPVKIETKSTATTTLSTKPSSQTPVTTTAAPTTTTSPSPSTKTSPTTTATSPSPSTKTSPATTATPVSQQPSTQTTTPSPTTVKAPPSTSAQIQQAPPFLAV